MTTTLFAAIFDVDGVLIDSYQPHLLSWQRIAKQHALIYTEEMFAKGFGRTSREIVAEDWGLSHLAADEIAIIDEAKEAAYREIVADEFPAMPGAAEVCKQLHADGFRIAVGSSGPRANVELAIEQLGIRPYLTAVVTGQDVTRGKPDPQIFLTASQKLDVAPENCVVIEDAPAGVQAAHAAGMVCVGYPSTGRTPPDVAAAEWVISKMTEINAERLTKLIRRGRVT